MPKQCRECRTVVNDGAPYCEACGCQFMEATGKPAAQTWRYVSAAIVLTVLGASFVFFELHR